jgi:hypothetical protein
MSLPQAAEIRERKRKGRDPGKGRARYFPVFEYSEKAYCETDAR